MLPVQHRSLEWIPGAGSIGMVPVDRFGSVWEPVVTGGPKSGRSQLPCAVRMQRVLHLSVCPAPYINISVAGADPGCGIGREDHAGFLGTGCEGL